MIFIGFFGEEEEDVEIDEEVGERLRKLMSCLERWIPRLVAAKDIASVKKVLLRPSINCGYISKL